MGRVGGKARKWTDNENLGEKDNDHPNNHGRRKKTVSVTATGIIGNELKKILLVILFYFFGENNI